MIVSASWLFLLAQVFFVDLLLGADNAIVIALACRRLSAQDAGRALALGAGGAIVLRLFLVLFANALLGVPLVKLVAAWTLVVIALNLRLGMDDDVDVRESVGSPTDLMSAAVVIALADAAMSLDNVVAVAAIAGGDPWLLVIGVLLTIPILAYGAFILSRIIREVPELLTIGPPFLGWIAGAMAVTDPLVADWLQTNAPGLQAFAPALVALFVWIAGRREQLVKAARPDAVEAVNRPAPDRASAGYRPSARAATTAPVAEPSLTAAWSIPEDEQAPAFASDSITAPATKGWTEEKVVVAGFALFAFLAGLIILIASFFDSLT